MSPILIFTFALVVLIVVTSGASFAIRYYTRRFEQGDRKAAVIIGVAFALLFPTMYCAENMFPGRIGEVLATGIMVTICVVGGFAAWRALAKPQERS